MELDEESETAARLADGPAPIQVLESDASPDEGEAAGAQEPRRRKSCLKTTSHQNADASRLPRSISFSQFVQEKEYDPQSEPLPTSIAAPAETKLAARTGNVPQVVNPPIKFEIMERGFSSPSASESDDSDRIYSEDDLERQLTAQQVSIAYHRKRQQLLSAGLLSGPKTEEELYKETIETDEPEPKSTPSAPQLTSGPTSPRKPMVRSVGIILTTVAIQGV
ncbi:hypothetical protein HDU91_002845 [Kappamyces sp. JEL0680]|nr:hypothetical protein HDU91_002845 [Kappamyces sp. JEL0680]